MLKFVDIFRLALKPIRAKCYRKLVVFEKTSFGEIE